MSMLHLFELELQIFHTYIYNFSGSLEYTAINCRVIGRPV